MPITARMGVVVSCVALSFSPDSAAAQAPRQIPLPQAPRLQPVNVWQQSNLQQALLQQNALNQLALQQWQFQNAFLYPQVPTVLYPPSAVQQQQSALLLTIQQLQQENALLYGWIQQQALQQLQQRQQGAPQNGAGQ